jgi:EAL domain-containing protein (putative c-di-GMP-specific phosphodiesterase class I)
MDKGFVHAAWRQPALKAIIEASYNMAHQLGISTVGEGVEDREDWDFLREIGCDLAQGYFIARPMPGADIPAWIENWKERYTSLA